MNTRRIILYAATALALATLATAASASPEEWERADNEYQVQHYANALAIYEQLAAMGDARAAELAGHMLLVGETLYGDSVQRDSSRAAKLLSQAAQAGRPVAMRLLRQVNVASATPIRNQ